MPYEASKDHYVSTASVRYSTDDPGRKGYIATPADTELPTYGKSMLITASGNLSFVPIDNSDAEIVGPIAVVAGQLIASTVRQIRAATTATVLVHV